MRLTDYEKSDRFVTFSVTLRENNAAGPEILLAPGEFRVIYEKNGILVVPGDPLTECTASSVNGEKQHLAPGAQLKFRCPAHIPPQKTIWFAEEYLEEPEMVMKDCSTPY